MLSMRRAFTLTEFVVVVGILCVLTATLWPTGIGNSRHNARRAMCQSNLKLIGLGFQQYAQDHEQRFPVTQTSSRTGLADALQPYVKSWTVFQCPENGTGRNANLTDYFYNARLSKLDVKKVSMPFFTILLGDGDFGAPTNEKLSALPQAWIEDKNSPAFRHLSFANYLFVDGHVKFLNVKDITMKAPVHNNYTFLRR
jgi:prepilin-type processing-associated H-X9-DG protein/prepilin-type N-terminal cleavage/methylation domain-containing protein